MADDKFVQFGTLPYSRQDLERCALNRLEDGTPQYFQFLLAIETLATLKTISDQLHALYGLQRPL